MNRFDFTPYRRTTVGFDRLFERPLVVSCQSTTWRKALDDVAQRAGRVFNAALAQEGTHMTSLDRLS